ncbi:MAG TPA: hypothetical protein DCR94_04995 [Firmicutes bacterium]|nr:hypothetical protein [Bacillota bacterium]
MAFPGPPPCRRKGFLFVLTKEELSQLSDEELSSLLASLGRGPRTKNWTIKEGNYGRRKIKETRIEVLPQVPQHGEDPQETPLLLKKRVLNLAQKRGEGTRQEREARRPAAGWARDRGGEGGNRREDLRWA